MVSSLGFSLCPLYFPGLGAGAACNSEAPTGMIKNKAPRKTCSFKPKDQKWRNIFQILNENFDKPRIPYSEKIPSEMKLRSRYC